MGIFGTYYLICLVYCVLMFIKSWTKESREGGLGISPGLDTLAILIMCWALAPVDIYLRWVRLYKEAEEARRRNNKIL